MRSLWVVLTVLWVLAASLSAFVAMFSPMLFDAPDATRNPLTIAFFLCVLALPVLWLVGAAAPWIFRSATWSGWLFLIPLVDVAVLAVLAVALERLCHGSLTCK